MKGSRWLIVVVILAVAGVLVAKEKVARSRLYGPREVGSATSVGSRAHKGPAVRSADIAREAQSRPGKGPQTALPLPGSSLAACLRSGRPTMADFGRDWCIPCKMMVPVLKKAAQDYRGKAHIVFVELDQYANLGQAHRIVAMPTQVFFNDRGKEVARHAGYLDNEGIDAQFAQMGAK